MNHRQTILLDFGGTLDSEGKHWSTQFADSFAATGFRADRAELDAAFLAVDRAVNGDPRATEMPFADYVLEYAQRLLAIVGHQGGNGGHGQVGRSVQARAIAEHFLHGALEHLRESGTLLAHHRELFRFAVLSNFTANLPLIVEEVGLGATVEEVLCSAIEGLRKPDPAIFRLALDRLGVHAGEAVMIGDSLGNDIQPAKALGLTTVWLRGDKVYGGGDPSAADHVVSSLAEALLVLSRAGGTRRT
jgi:HAD superfamily hydrolase (TIGR01509 family)